MMAAIAGTTFSKAIALLDYQLNKNYIATTLCENRNKPACCCHGKCFLKKQLQKDEESSKSNLPFSKDKFEVSLFCENDLNKYFPIPVGDKIFSHHYLLIKYATVLSSIFHPPATA
jgi:hypothetical protein